MARVRIIDLPLLPGLDNTAVIAVYQGGVTYKYTLASIAGGDQSVTTADIADFAVTDEKLADGAVSSRIIEDDAVTTAKIAEQAITTSKMRDLHITADKLAPDSVTTPKIADLSVTPAKIDTAFLTLLLSDTIRKEIEAIDGAITYVLEESASVKYKINTIAAKVDGGSFTFKVRINGTPVQWLAGGQTLTCNTAAQLNDSAVSDNTVEIGNRVTITVDSSTSAIRFNSSFGIIKQTV